jgi:predicted O-methyltransferase YrrM
MLTIPHILDLYRRYLSDLKAVRRQQFWFHRRHDNPLVRRLRKWRVRRYMLFPALDDLEAEITYLLIRDQRPKVVMEVSPNAGWSSTWILSALRDNADGGQLWSYDLHDTSTRFVPRALSQGRWHIVLGDARETVAKAPDFDYLVIDSDHSKGFAEWYVQNLFPRIRRGTHVGVHDVFHRPEPSEEGAVVIAWLDQRGLSFWTPSSACGGAGVPHLLEERKRLGVDYRIHYSESNPMLFFEA